MANIVNIEQVKVNELIPYINNAKVHSEEQVLKIASSIREFGFLAPVLIDNDNNIWEKLTGDKAVLLNGN